MTPDRNAWATPPDLFALLHARYAFPVGACADASNAKHARYWDAATSGLTQAWAGEHLFINPPYGRGLIQPWVDRALKHRDCAIGVLLLPVRTDADWFQALWAECKRGGPLIIDFLPERVRFIPPEGVKASSPNERNMVVVVGRP